MNRLIIDVDGYRWTICGHDWFPESMRECIVCPECSAARKNKGRHGFTGMSDSVVAHNSSSISVPAMIVPLRNDQAPAIRVLLC